MTKHYFVALKPRFAGRSNPLILTEKREIASPAFSGIAMTGAFFKL